MYLDSPSVLFWTKDNVVKKKKQNKFEKNPRFTALKHSSKRTGRFSAPQDIERMEAFSFNLQIPRVTLFGLTSSLNSWRNCRPEQRRETSSGLQRCLHECYSQNESQSNLPI